MKKVDNFFSALRNLADIYLFDDNISNVELTGLVALFGICFEQAWKAMKEILEYEGYAASVTGSPRAILKTANASGLIKDEEQWLEALASRNNIAYSYNKDIAYDILKKTRNIYYAMFSELAEEIRKNHTYEQREDS